MGESVEKVIENININLRKRYSRVRRLLRKGYWLRALDPIDKIARKADIYISLDRPDIVTLEYKNIGSIESMRIETFHGGVFTIIQLTNVKDKRELTIKVIRTILMETPE